MRHAVCSLLFIFSAILLTCGVGAVDTSFENFHARAEKGERLNVVFYGCSLTWGANASDPTYTSYRGYIAAKFEAAYPNARFHFIDAAIGGTNSVLGAFRMERDVMRHKPDLVFIDFSANDDIYGSDDETLGSYESILRRAVLEAKCPAVQVIFPFQWNANEKELPKMKRRDAHLQLAKTYGMPSGDAIALAIERIKSGATTPAKLWPMDGVHPCDEGYALFADAAWDAFQSGVKNKMVCAAPEKMVYPDTYMTWTRNRLSALKALPAGWSTVATLRTAAWHDALMSRWLEDEVRASNIQIVKDEKGKDQKVPQKVEPLKLKFQAKSVFFFGTRTPTSCKFKVTIDGQPTKGQKGQEPGVYETTSANIGGNTHLSQLIASGLDPEKTHELILEPLVTGEAPQELRFESICLAGGAAKLVE